jgi:hypothetical protein
MLLCLPLERLRQEAVPIGGPTFVSIGGKNNANFNRSVALPYKPVNRSDPMFRNRATLTRGLGYIVQNQTVIRMVMF